MKTRNPLPAINETIAVMDTNGDLSPVGLGFVSCAFGEVFPVGTILAIKEPNKTCNPDPVVTSPSDIVLVDATDGPTLKKLGALMFYTSDLRSLDQLRQDGNKRFASEDFQGALVDYERALRLQPDAAVIHLNKSAALLKMERFYEAYHAAEKALGGGASRAKALFRLGQAAYGLRWWQASVDNFIMLRKEFPTNTDGRDCLAKALDRLKESRTGKYDMNRLQTAAFGEHARLIDAADWMGPVEVVSIPGKGIIARADITKGTLLIVSKAIACSGASDFSDYELIKHGNKTTLRTTEYFHMFSQFVKDYLDQVKPPFEPGTSEIRVPLPETDEFGLEDVRLLSNFLATFKRKEANWYERCFSKGAVFKDQDANVTPPHPWVSQFCDRSAHHALIGLLNAADFLAVHVAIVYLTRCMADKLDGMSVPQMRQYLHQEDDLTAEELEEHARDPYLREIMERDGLLPPHIAGTSGEQL